MIDEQYFQEIESRIQRVIDAETEDFFELAKILDLNPLTDFAGADLREVNLSGKNLQGANLRQTNLSSADLSNADLSGADLSYADLSGANLIGANLSEANLSNVSVENAKFGNNQGICQRLKLDWIDKGAIFENSADSDINYETYKKLTSNQSWVEKNKGKYVTITDGQWDGKIYVNKEELMESLKRQKEPPKKPPLIEEIGEEQTIELSNLNYVSELN